MDIELEFIRNHKKKPKTEDFFDIGGADSEEDDFLAQLEKEDAMVAKDTAEARDQRFLRRLQPTRPLENKAKIEQLFRVHQMEALRELKEHYDKLTDELDRDDGTLPDKFERIKENQESQKLYHRYLTLMQHVEDLISTIQAIE